MVMVLHSILSIFTVRIIRLLLCLISEDTSVQAETLVSGMNIEPSAEIAQSTPATVAF